MPWQSVRIVPGLDTEQTPSLLEGRYSTASLIRWREGLPEKLGGWQPYFNTTFDGTIRELCAWQSLANNKYLGVGEETNIYVLSNGALQTLTPQSFTSNLSSINFSTTLGSQLVTIVDLNIDNITFLDTLYIKTPISIGGLVLAGPYTIASILSPSSYTIISPLPATSTVASGGVAPSLTTSAGTTYVTVNLPSHGLSAQQQITLAPNTSVGGLNIGGVYQIYSVVDADNFQIIATAQAASSAGPVSISPIVVYNIGLGPSGGTTGYGTGGWGVGGWGTGTTSTQQTGTPVQPADWTMVSWGEDLVACAQGGGIYYWGPESGNQTLLPIPNAPPYNNGIMLAMPQLVLVAWGSTSELSLGFAQDPLLIKWCQPGDFTNWTATNATLAGDFRLSRGSAIVGGFQSTLRTLLWTDVELWSMDWIGYPYAFQFNSLGKNCGLIGRSAVAELGGAVFWMGQSNFYVFSGGGVSPLPCPVYDAVFQDLDTANAWKIKAGVTAGFNEVWFFYPSKSGGTGENDKYVKYNIAESAWDAGTLPRSAWISESILGTPIGASPVDNMLYQHEIGYAAYNAPMASEWGTGWICMADGEQIPFIDFYMPDLRYGLLNSAPAANINISFKSVNYLNDTPVLYGPFAINSSTEWTPLRIRGRFVSMQQTDTSPTFWRQGRPRFRIAPSGRVG